MHRFLSIFLAFFGFSFIVLYHQYATLTLRTPPSPWAPQTDDDDLFQTASIRPRELIEETPSASLKDFFQTALGYEQAPIGEETPGASLKQVTLSRSRIAREAAPACEGVGYTINSPHAWCPSQSSEVVLVVLVASAPHNVVARDRIRKTWASVGSSGGVRVIVRFFVGAINSTATSATALNREAGLHRDIIQQTYLDSYNNLTLKTLGALRWTASFCQVAHYALKTDDDTFINIYNVARFLLRRPSREAFLCAGTMKTGIVNRVPSNKWYVSKEAWPRKLFPPYCHGFGYFLPVKKIVPILEKSCTLPKITVEDAFMGIVAYHLNITHVYPATEPKQLLKDPSMVISNSSLFPLALWTSKSRTDKSRFEKVLEDYERYQSSLLFVAHLEHDDTWHQLWGLARKASVVMG